MIVRSHLPYDLILKALLGQGISVSSCIECWEYRRTSALFSDRIPQPNSKQPSPILLLSILTSVSLNHPRAVYFLRGLLFKFPLFFGSPVVVYYLLVFLPVGRHTSCSRCVGCLVTHPTGHISDSSDG